MTAEAGHAPSRSYRAQDGSFHNNGAAFYNDNEQDVSALLGAGTAGSTTVAASTLVIPVTHDIVKKTTGASGEALTLANGSIGQMITIILVTDGGGDGTLTPATATGWATIVFADAGDTATLKYSNDTDGWIIVGLSGKLAPPVFT